MRRLPDEPVLRFQQLALTDLRRGLLVRWAWQANAASSLPDDEVHLWLADLARAPLTEMQSRQLLSQSELERADKLQFAADQRRYIFRRAILRQLVGGYLGQLPATVEFTTNQFGKPRLPAGELEFNLSVAGDFALYGFVRGHPLGVDLAQRTPEFEWQGIVDSLFHPAEAVYIRSQPANEQSGAFFRLWTIKEAFVKAEGGGLTQPAAQEDFTAWARGERCARVQPDGTRWWCVGWEPATTMAAALVVKD